MNSAEITGSDVPLLECLPADLERVDAELHSSVEATDAFVTDLAQHLISAGGKRVRPGFAIAASLVCDNAGGPARFEAIRGGASVELVHLGSLYHDDVMDGATTRRSVPSVNAQWGNLRAILAGDYLLGRASEIAASLGSEVAALLARTITQLCEGQIVELEAANDLGRSPERYFAAIEGKTAALLATSCRIGAVVAELPSDVVDSLESFGHAYGMAFQIVDDILDLVSTETQLGKPAGNDLLEGNYTLPVIRALASSDELRGLLSAELTPTALEQAREIVASSGGLAQAQAEARSWTAKADDALASLDATPAVNFLRTGTTHLLARLNQTA